MVPTQPSRNSRRLFWALIAVAWGALVVGGYYVYHKPLPPAQLPGFARTLHAVAAWAGTLFVGYLLGWRMLGGMLAEEAPTARFSLTLGFGLGALGLLMLVLGALGGLRSPVAALLLLVAVIAAVRWRVPLCPRRLSWPESRAERWLAAFVLLMLATAALAALAPPTAWDVLVYHLTGPALYLQAGRLTHPIDLPYLGFPQWGEMLFTFAMLLGSDRAPALLHWTFAPLTLSLLWPLARRVAPGRAWLAAALLVATPTASLIAGYAYVEWLQMFAVTAALYALLRWDESQRRHWLALAGVAAGLSFAAKYTSAGAIVGLGLAVLFLSPTRFAVRNVLVLSGASEPTAPKSEFTVETQSPQSSIQTGGVRARSAATSWLRVLRVSAVRGACPWDLLRRHALVFGAAALLVTLPWLLKNLALTGNPTYPFFFDGLHWDAQRAFWYARPGTGLSLRALALAPLQATLRGTEGSPPYGATIGPLLLVLIPLLLVGWRARTRTSRRGLALLLLVAASAYGLWLLQMAWSGLLAQTRLLLPVFPALAVLAAAAFDGLQTLATRALRVRWVLGGLLVLVFVFTGLQAVANVIAVNPLPVLVGAQSEADYRRERLGLYALVMEALDQMPPETQVVFLWEPRAYTCVPGCWPDALLDRWWHARQSGAAAREIAAQWRAQGVTHVLLYVDGAETVRAAGFDPFTEADWVELSALQSQLSVAENFNDAYVLYDLTPK